MTRHPNAPDLTNLDTYSRVAFDAMHLGPKFAEAIRSQHAEQTRTNVYVVEHVSGTDGVQYFIHDSKTRIRLVFTTDKRTALEIEKRLSALDDDAYLARAAELLKEAQS